MSIEGTFTKLLVIMSLLLPLTSYSHPINCYTLFQRTSLKVIKGTPRYSWKYAASPALRSLFYPFFIPHRLHQIYQASKNDAGKSKFKEFLKRDFIFALAFAAQGVFRYSMFTTLGEMDTATEADKIGSDDVVVYLNVFDPDADEDFYKYTRDFFKFRYPFKKKAIYIEAKDLPDLLTKLNEVKEKYGSIKKLESNGHSSSWGFRVQEEGVGKGSLADALKKVDIPDDLFTNDAQLVFNSCWIPRHQEGREFLEEFGKGLLKKGGTVFATKTTFVGSPNLVTTYAMQPFLVYRGYTELEETEESKPIYFDKIQKFKIEPSENNLMLTKDLKLLEMKR